MLTDSADALIARQPSAGLATVDEAGRPRVRKVEQLAHNPAVTVYFDEDDRTSYATIMGRAIVHRDPGEPRLQEFLDSATIRFFWPDFPSDFVMLEIVPDWLEFVGPGLWNDPDTWRPRAVVLQASPRTSTSREP